jgi:peptidoglycan/LPS O-acetylase OafA/YrhL
LLLAPARQVPLEPVRQAPGHVPALDGIRGAAAAAVFIYHYGGGARSSNFAVHFVGETIHLGWAGVSLFFVLSGFLITGILLDSMQRPSWWKTFYIRRTLRIFPLYYTALLGAMFVHLSLRRSWSSIAPVWPYFFYLQDIPALVRFEVLSPLFSLGHFWSLAVEEHFYLVWPFLLSLANRRDRVRQLCLSIYLLSLIFRICVFGLHLSPAWAIYFLGGRAGEMAAGGFLAALLHGSELGKGRVLPGARSLLVASAASLTAVVLWTRGTRAEDPWLGTIGIALFSLLFAALIASSLQPGMVARIFSLPVLGWLGRISYGIYVYHLLLYPAFAWLTHELFPRSTGEIYLLELAAVATVGTLSAAAISFATLESRFLRLKGVIGNPIHS